MRFRHLEPAINERENPGSGDSLVESPKRIPSQLAVVSSVEEVMREEWEHVRMEYGNLPPIPHKRLKVSTYSTPPVVNSGNKDEDHFTVSKTQLHM